MCQIIVSWRRHVKKKKTYSELTWEKKSHRKCLDIILLVRQFALQWICVKQICDFHLPTATERNANDWGKKIKWIIISRCIFHANDKRNLTLIRRWPSKKKKWENKFKLSGFVYELLQLRRVFLILTDIYSHKIALNGEYSSF